MPDLEIFLSWSRPVSHQAAQAFADWLPDVLPGSKPWLSSEDITKGTPWFSSLSAQLAKSHACLIFVTPENANSPWLFFEAGAIAHAMQGALICPYLIGVKPGDLSGAPLGQYQATVFDKDDTWRLLRGLNARLPSPHHEGLLASNFKTSWPKLQAKLSDLATNAPTKPPAKPEEPDLSAEARHILIEASRDKNGKILMTKTNHGFSVQANGKQLCDSHDARAEAAYREAVNDLVSRQLLEDRGRNGQAFALTGRGWTLADELRKEEPSAPRTVITDDADALCLLKGWFGSRTEDANHKAIAFEDVDRELNLTPGTATRLLETAAQKYSYVVDQKGPKFIVFKKVYSSTQAPSFSDPGWSDPRNPFRRR
jgi:hypothetical protein